MMVPVYHDLVRGKTKVWVLLGLAEKRLELAFARPPRVVAVRDESGNEVPLSSVRVTYEAREEPYAYFVSREALVGRLLDRPQFQKHCDRFRTEAEILSHLR